MNYTEIEIEGMKELLREKEEENRKLKEKYDGLWKIYTSEANELKEENKKLKQMNDVYVPRALRLEEENKKLKLHIEAKDKAYTTLLKDYEKMKEDNLKLKEEVNQ